MCSINKLKNDKYYKLYILSQCGLRSKFRLRQEIKINEKYCSENEHIDLHFANIDHILDFLADDHGHVVCDITPLGKVKHSEQGYSKVECMCKTIIPSNPRSIYSPSFIKELIENGDNNVWRFITDVSFAFGAIEHFNDGVCYGISLDFDLAESLKMLMLDVYPQNQELNRWFCGRRQMFRYEDLYEKATYSKVDNTVKKVIVDSWNK